MPDRRPAAAAFFESVRKGDERAVGEAVALDPDLLLARDEVGLSPILAAAFSGHSQLAEHLAERVVGMPDGLSIFEAATVGNAAVVRQRLAEDRAAIDDGGDEGFTALHLAAYFGRLEVARLLLGLGADRNAVAMNQMRVTPLHSAVSARHRDMTSLLLAHGASPNAVQRGGWTPLHAAAKAGDEEIVDMLLLRGADPTRKNDDGLTAIDMADQGGHGAIAKILRNYARR
jgi:ankyrin repeat protein